MSKTIKSLMIKVTLAILMLAMVGFVFTTVNFRSAKAEETATGVFEFVGTYINVEEVTDGEAGYDATSAKFEAKVDKTYYDAIEVKEGETLKFFTLVSTSDEEPTLEKVEGSENRIVVAYWYPDFTEIRTEFTSNTYIENFPAERYASEFTVRVGYTVGETTEYVDSVKTSLVGVASQAINAGCTENLSKYLGEAKTLVGAETAYAALNNGDTVKVEIPAMENVKAYIQGNTTATDVTVSEEGGKTYATLKVSDFANFATGENAKVNFVGTGAYYTTSVKVINFEIDSPEDFALWYEKIQEVKYVNLIKDVPEESEKVYAILTDNIDLKDTTITNAFSDQTKGGAFAGEFDGQGHTISNLTVTGTYSMFATSDGCVIKNVAFVNFVSKATDNGYIFAQANSTITFENVYLDFTPTKVTSNPYHGVCNIAYQFNAKDSVLKFNYPKNTYPAFRNTSPTTMDNVIVIANQDTFSGEHATLEDAIEESESLNHVYENVKWYKTQAQANTAINGEKPAGFGEDWVVSNGVLTFESAVDYLEKAYPIPTELTIGVSEDGIEGEYNVTVGTYDLTTSIEGATIQVTSSGDYTLSGNTLTINAGVTNDQEINLKATYVNPFWAVDELKEEITLTIVIEKQYVDVKEQLVGLNRASVMTLNLTDLGLTEANVVGATYNNAEIETPTISEGVLTVDLSAESLTSNTNGYLQVELQDAQTVVLNIPVRVVNYAIKTEKEFVDWRTDAQQPYSSKPSEVTNSIYAGLDGDVVLTEILAAHITKTAMCGELDGRGYSVTGLAFVKQNTRHTIANTYNNFTFKNISITVEYFYQYLWSNSDSYNGLSLENVYLKMNGGVMSRFAHTGGAFHNIKNVYVDALAQTGKAWTDVLYSGVPSGVIENFIVLASPLTSWGAQKTVDKLVNSAYFTSMDAFKTDLAGATPTVDTSKFDSNWWTVDSDGVPVFKANA